MLDGPQTFYIGIYKLKLQRIGYGSLSVHILSDTLTANRLPFLRSIVRNSKEKTFRILDTLGLEFFRVTW